MTELSSFFRYLHENVSKHLCEMLCLISVTQSQDKVGLEKPITLLECDVMQIICQ